MRFAFTTILQAPRFGWQSAPDRSARLGLYGKVREAGFDGIEWSPRWLDYDGLSGSEIASLKQEALDHDLTISGLNLNRFILTRCSEAGRHRERLGRSIEAARRLEAESVIVSLSMPQPPSDDRPCLIGRTIPREEFDRTAGWLRELAPRAGDQGVQLVLELHDDGLLDTPELCLRMHDTIDRPNVRINPDLGNLVRHPDRRERWRDALRQLAPHAGYWHVKNYREGRPAPVWDGDIDYAEAFSTMRRHGYDGWVSIESYFGEDIMALQRQSLGWLRELEAKVVS